MSRRPTGTAGSGSRVRVLLYGIVFAALIANAVVSRMGAEPWINVALTGVLVVALLIDVKMRRSARAEEARRR